MIKVGFDISQSAFFGGVAVYSNKLAEHLDRITDLNMIFFYTSMGKKYDGKLKNIKEYKIPSSISELLFNTLRVPIERFIGDVDIFHSSDWVQPKTKAKKITTYHDVIPIKFPEWSHPKIIEVHKRRLGIVEKEIDCVIAVSQSTKNDLIKISKIPPEKIVVIYEGVGDEFKMHSEKEIEQFKKKYKLPNKFALAIGGIGSRRNLDRVKEITKDYNLVVLGEDIKNISKLEVSLLYASASVLLYPSLYEGFGLPILEAMSCGTPVITSNVSSMPEVGGDACIYANPTNVDDLRKKLKIVWEDKNLRADLIKKGLKQVTKFSWNNTANQTAAVYRSLL